MVKLIITNEDNVIVFQTQIEKPITDNYTLGKGYKMKVEYNGIERSEVCDSDDT